jgi:tRNA threonylcarbamoyl adenosine modification protein YeaZ
MTSPLILSLETATIGGSVWLGFGITELATRIGDPKVSQSASLLRDISDCLDEAGVKLAEVDLFACAAGPGSFTGLRIGIATLKALAASLNRPCVGIPTQNAVALAGGPSDATVALLPAGRGEVFAQMFSVKDEGVVTALDTAAHLTPAKLLERYAGFQQLTWAGSGAHAQRGLIEECARERNIRFFDEVTIAEATDADKTFWYLTPLEPNLAKHVAVLALQLFHSGGIQSPDSLSAIYVRPSDAELNQCR